MAFQVKFSEQSEGDLAEIIRYISASLCAPKAAERFYSAVSKQLSILAENPRIYPLHRDDFLKAKGLRFVAIDGYLMFYTIDEGDNIVYIARIIYGKRDLTAAFE